MHYNWLKRGSHTICNSKSVWTYLTRQMWSSIDQPNGLPSNLGTQVLIYLNYFTTMVIKTGLVYKIINWTNFDFFAFWKLNTTRQWRETITILKFAKVPRFKKLSNLWKIRQNLHFGCRHSSEDSSAPSILPPRVWVPSTHFTLLSIYIWIVSCEK